MKQLSEFKGFGLSENPFMKAKLLPVKETVEYVDRCVPARPGQKVLIHKALHKNQYLAVFEYLSNSEIFSFALTTKSVWQKVSGE